MVESAALLVDDVFPVQPVRQWVLTVPFPLRFLFAAYPELMGKVLGIVTRAISTHLAHQSGHIRQDVLSLGCLTHSTKGKISLPGVRQALWKAIAFCAAERPQSVIGGWTGGGIALGLLGGKGVVESIFWFVWAIRTVDLLGIWAEDLLIVEHSPAIWTTSHSRDTFYVSYTRKVIGGKIVRRIRNLARSFDVKDAKKVSSALRQILKDPQLKRLAANGTSALRLFASVGGVRIAKFERQSKDWRVNRWLVLFSMIFLIEEYDEKRLQLTGENQLTSLIGNLFSKSKSNYNGAVFQIV